MSWLSHTPFTGWTLPGLALLIGVALPQLTAAALIAASHRWALAASYLAGLAVIAWIAVQLLVLQRYFFLQPVIAGFGLAEVLLSWIWQRRTDNTAPGRASAAAARHGGSQRTSSAERPCRAACGRPRAEPAGTRWTGLPVPSLATPLTRPVAR